MARIRCEHRQVSDRRACVPSSSSDFQGLRLGRYLELKSGGRLGPFWRQLLTDQKIYGHTQRSEKRSMK